jgi:hypothetical protein
MYTPFRSCRECVGTPDGHPKLFRAIDRNPIAHMYRHNLELLFYVLVWITSRHHDGEEIVKPPLQDWTEDQALVEKKRSFLSTTPPAKQKDSILVDTAYYSCTRCFAMEFGKDSMQNYFQPHTLTMTLPAALSRLTFFKRFLITPDVYCIYLRSLFLSLKKR